MELKELMEVSGIEEVKFAVFPTHFHQLHHSFNYVKKKKGKVPITLSEVDKT
jgi:hypothetical protein